MRKRKCGLLKKMKDVFFWLTLVTMVVYTLFCFQVWLAGYDSLYQYFNTIG